jgi:isocitrate dehydrogenase kinase/phosphatase
MVDPVNADEALVTKYRRDNLNISCGGNAIDIHVFISGSLMPRRWQLHHQDRVGRLTPCLFRNLIVFKRSMRKKSWIDYLLMNQCSRIRTQIGQYHVRTLYQKGRLAQLNKIMGEYKLAFLGVSATEDQLSKRRVTAGMN